MIQAVQWITTRIPEHNRRLFARIGVWGGMALCLAVWVHLMGRLHVTDRSDTGYSAYFAARCMTVSIAGGPAGVCAGTAPADGCRADPAAVSVTSTSMKTDQPRISAVPRMT